MTLFDILHRDGFVAQTLLKRPNKLFLTRIKSWKYWKNANEEEIAIANTARNEHYRDSEEKVSILLRILQRHEENKRTQ